MRDLTAKEFWDAPPLIQYIITVGNFQQFIGISTYDEAIEKYPEYFPDEIEHRRKRSLVPKEVDDAYFKV